MAVTDASLVASRLDGTIADRRWSLGGAGACHLLLLRAGRAVLTRSDAASEIAAPTLLWVPARIPATLDVLAGSEGFQAAMPVELARRTMAATALGGPLRPLLEQIVLAGPEAIRSRLAPLTATCAALAAETQDMAPGASAVIAMHLGLLFVQLWRCAGLALPTGARGAGTATAQRFGQLVELHYRDGMSIDAFAARLGVSRAHLHEACRRATGRSPLAMLHDRLLDEARARLSQTDLPVEQVGFGLGFGDPAYFNRFFKRLTGQSPGAYRRANVAARPPAAPTASFAAWP